MANNNDSPTYTNARLKAYPDKTLLQVATSPIFPYVSGVSRKRPYDVPPPGCAKDHNRALEESKRRAKARVQDIALCNHFEYLFTWTLDGKLIDRYDAKVIYSKVKNFLGNTVKRKDFTYVLVPEFHKQKSWESKAAIHMHGLCSLGKVPIVRAVSKSGKPLYDEHNRPIFNMPTWTWGFSTCVPIDDQYERTAHYVTKYITKSNEKIFGKWYLASRNIAKRPQMIPLEPMQYHVFRDAQKLERYEQTESKIYPGLSIITEKLPALGASPNTL